MISSRRAWNPSWKSRNNIKVALYQFTADLQRPYVNSGYAKRLENTLILFASGDRVAGKIAKGIAPVSLNKAVIALTDNYGLKFSREAVKNGRTITFKYWLEEPETLKAQFVLGWLRLPSAA